MDRPQPVIFKIKRKPVGFKDQNIPIASTAALDDGAVDAEPHRPPRQSHSQSQPSRSRSSDPPSLVATEISACSQHDAKGKSLRALVPNAPHATILDQHEFSDPTTSDVLSGSADPPPYDFDLPTTTLPVDHEGKTTPLAADTAQKSSSSSSSSSFLKTALDEARFFAGGLLPRPHESTKHYTILRHSPSIIFYHGSSTSVAITIFSSSSPEPLLLPADRTIWLQQRGFSGDTGMKLKRLVGATGSWLDVTPTMQLALPAAVVSEQEQDAAAVAAAAAAAAAAANSNATKLSADERGWRRDIAKFMKKHAPQHKTGRSPRETLVIRLPALVEDGYFRLVLCTGGGTGKGNKGDNTSSSTRRRKALCASPVFRVASTSFDPSILKGASLKTLPLELGVLIGSTVGMGKATAALAPVKNKVQSQVQQALQPVLQPAEDATTAARVAAAAVPGLRRRVTAAEVQFGQVKDATAPSDVFGEIEEGTSIDLDVVGSDDGPDRPFPIRFVGNVVPGTGTRRSIPGVPTANLSGIPNDTKYRLKGTYLGWACALPTKKAADMNVPPADWYEAVISAGPAPHDIGAAGTKAGVVAAKHIITVHLIHDFGPSCTATTTTFFPAKLEVLVLGILSSNPAPSLVDDTTTAEAVVERNIQVTLSSLSRANWGPQVTLRKMREGDYNDASSNNNSNNNDNNNKGLSAKSSRTFSDRYVQARHQMQRRADSLPLHIAGVRTAGAEARDRVIGNGGYWVARS